MSSTLENSGGTDSILVPPGAALHSTPAEPRATAPGKAALRVAFLGGGFMARVHSRAARMAGAELVGIATSSPESGREAAKTLGISQSFDSAEQLLNDPSIDVVHICSPNATHADFARQAIAAGKHVVCEKPLATSLELAKGLVELAEAAGVVATVPFVYRYHPMVRELRRRVIEGEAGSLFSVTGSYLQDWLLHPSDDNWRVTVDDGGPSRAFADIGSHLVDLLEFVTNDRIVQLTAQIQTVHNRRGGELQQQNEDQAVLLIQTEQGAIGTLFVSQVAPGRKNALVIELAGSEESLRFEQENPENLWVGRRVGSQLLTRDPDSLTGDAKRLSTVPAGHPLGYQDAFNAFVADTYAAIETGEVPSGTPSFADGARAVSLTEAVLESSKHRAWIETAMTQESEVLA
ncbi:Gfo/Idh/MocA family protein [Humidisolicoccus flavus]|uniref:Gfo/Idh/MocA family protein n=1 Tax=Humidisolicoccus flavus TaxID=3111414 RepID=UPI003248D638